MHNPNVHHQRTGLGRCGIYTQWSTTLVFLGLHLQHMEVPSPGVKLELQLQAFATTTATWDLSCVFHLHHGPRQHRILNPLSDAIGIKPVSSWMQVRFVSTEPRRELQIYFFLKCDDYLCRSSKYLFFSWAQSRITVPTLLLKFTVATLFVSDCEKWTEICGLLLAWSPKSLLDLLCSSSRVGNILL